MNSLRQQLMDEFEEDDASDSSSWIEEPDNLDSDMDDPDNPDSDNDDPMADDSTESSDEDDGYDSLGNSSEPEEIIMDKRYETPEPPPSMNLVPFFDRQQRMEDRYRPSDKRLSRGYEGTGHPLRAALRNSYLSTLTYNGFKSRRQPIRITGYVKHRGELFYYVEWEISDRPLPIKAHIMTRNCPNLVLRYHRNRMTNPSTYRHL